MWTYLGIRKFIASATHLSVLNKKLVRVYVKAFLFIISKTLLISATSYLCNIKFWENGMLYEIPDRTKNAFVLVFLEMCIFQW